MVTLEESITLAPLVVLESLTPAERVAFVLHDVLDVPFAQIAKAVGRTPHACRQLASTARRHLSAQPRFAPDCPEHDRVVPAFVQACQRGDAHALTRALDPGVVACSDGGGGIAGTARRPIHGHPGRTPARQRPDRPTHCEPEPASWP